MSVKQMRENNMLKLLSLAIAVGFGALTLLAQTPNARAAAAAPLQVLQIEKFFEPDELVQKAHGWHCGNAYGPYGWHHHPGACRSAY
ncbi:MAG: hypothetical protein HKN05_00125, partial [Rhizobiales bacterium]|nr:hypothetical protein [Hyphomicrobiales bacterium]